MKALTIFILLFLFTEIQAVTKDFIFIVEVDSESAKTEGLRKAILDDLLVIGFSRARTKGMIVHRRVTSGTTADEEFLEKYEHIYEATFALDYRKGRENVHPLNKGVYKIEYSMPRSYHIEILTTIMNDSTFNDLKNEIINLHQTIDKQYVELFDTLSNLNTKFEFVVSLIEASKEASERNSRAKEAEVRKTSQQLAQTLNLLSEGQESMYQEIVKIPGQIKEQNEKLDDIFGKLNLLLLITNKGIFRIILLTIVILSLLILSIMIILCMYRYLKESGRITV